MQKIRFLPLLAALALAGCGGHGSHSASSVPAVKGHVSFSVTWPKTAARYIPSGANFIRVSITDASGVKDTIDFYRNDVAAGGTSTKTNSKALAEGDCTISASSYSAGPDSSGNLDLNPLAASGNATVGVLAGQTVTTTLTMDFSLTNYRFDLKDVATGASISNNLIVTNNGTAPTVTLKPDQIVNLTATPQAASGGALMLVPVGSTHTTITPPSNVRSYGTTYAGNKITATFAPGATGSGSLQIKYTDAGTPDVTFTIPVAVGAINPNVVPSDVTFTAATTVDALTSNLARGYSLVRTVTALQAYDPANSSAVPELLTLVASPTIGSATATELAYASKGGLAVSNDANTTSITIPNSVAFLASDESTNYAVSVSTTSATVYRLNFATGTPSALAAFTTIEGPAAFAVGHDLATGGNAYYTVEGAAGSRTVRRYVSTNGSYGLDLPFGKAIPSAVGLAVEGNLVWVVSQDGSVQVFDLVGDALGTPSIGTIPANANATGISVRNGHGVVSFRTTDATPVDSTRAFTY